jgi:methionyl-tRNA formyltransferase
MEPAGQPRVVFFGTPQFSLPALAALVNEGYDIAAVITAPDRPAGRGLQLQSCPVATYAREQGLFVVQPDKLSRPEILPMLEALHASVAVLVAYGHIIPPGVLQLFAHGIVNIHPSLLPLYRGSSPIAGVLLDGITETGVTLMLLDEAMDHGPIIAQRREQITSADTNETLHQQLSKIGAELLVESLPKYLAGTLVPQPQDHTQATYTKLIKPENGRINWNLSAEVICRAWRAYQPWPGQFTTWQRKRLKFGRLEAVEAIPQGSPGLCKAINGRIHVSCGSGSIQTHELQLEGGKMLAAADFLRGYPGIIGTTLG